MKAYKVSHEIIQEIAILQEGKNLWRKELNLVSWNGAEPKYDVRWWSAGRLTAGRGLTFTFEELGQLMKAVKSLPSD